MADAVGRGDTGLGVMLWESDSGEVRRGDAGSGGDAWGWLMLGKGNAARGGKCSGRDDAVDGSAGGRCDTGGRVVLVEG